MSSFLDKAKDKATQLANQAKEKVDEQQNKRKADDLLDDIGRIVYRQRTTGTVEPDDDAAIDALVAELDGARPTLGTDILGDQAAAAAGRCAASDLPPRQHLPPPAARAPIADARQHARCRMPEPGNG